MAQTRFFLLAARTFVSGSRMDLSLTGENLDRKPIQFPGPSLFQNFKFKCIEIA